MAALVSQYHREALFQTIFKLNYKLFKLGINNKLNFIENSRATIASNFWLLNLFRASLRTLASRINRPPFKFTCSIFGVRSTAAPSMAFEFCNTFCVLGNGFAEFQVTRGLVTRCFWGAVHCWLFWLWFHFCFCFFFLEYEKKGKGKGHFHRLVCIRLRTTKLDKWYIREMLAPQVYIYI